MLGDHTTASGEVVHRPAQETCVCNDVAVVGEHPHSGGPEIVQVGQFNAGPALRDGTGRNHFRPVPSRRAGPALNWPTWTISGPPECGCSPTTATSLQTQVSCAGRWTTSPLAVV